MDRVEHSSKSHSDTIVRELRDRQQEVTDLKMDNERLKVCKCVGKVVLTDNKESVCVDCNKIAICDTQTLAEEVNVSRIKQSSR